MVDEIGPLWWASIDGAKVKSGWVLWHGVELMDHGIIEGLDPEPWGWLLFNTEAVVLEDGFIGKSKRTGLVLARARGTIEGYARVEGCEVWPPMQASKWRSIVGISTQLAREGAKQAAAAMCRWLAMPPAQRSLPVKPDSVWTDVHLPTLGNVPEDVGEAALLGLAYLRVSGAV
jgi:hypothetical protein